MLSGTRAAVAVKLFGDDLYEQWRLARQVETAMQAVPGLVDLFVEQQAEIPLVHIDLDRAALARHGLLGQVEPELMVKMVDHICVSLDEVIERLAR